MTTGGHSASQVLRPSPKQCCRRGAEAVLALEHPQAHSRGLGRAAAASCAPESLSVHASQQRATSSGNGPRSREPHVQAGCEDALSRGTQSPPFDLLEGTEFS